MKKLITISLLLASFILLTSSTPPPRWEHLGTKKVTHKVDHDVIVVTAAEGVFTKLKFKVLISPVHIMDMKVHFRNGQVQDIQLRQLIPAGGQSRVIDLAGNKRFIKKVTFFYKTEGMGPNATVKLYGKH